MRQTSVKGALAGLALLALGCGEQKEIATTKMSNPCHVVDIANIELTKYVNDDADYMVWDAEFKDTEGNVVGGIGLNDRGKGEKLWFLCEDGRKLEMRYLREGRFSIYREPSYE